MAMMGLIEEVYRMPLCPMSDALKEKLSESLRELNIL
jgi:dihydrodipicolinate synthase/N-acetylneuraminate lyase